jgi:hypothetical protein
MISVFRILDPDFDPPATVESFGVRPHLTRSEANPQEADRQLRKLAQAGVAQIKRQESTSAGTGH